MTTFGDSYFTEKYGLTRTHSDVLHAMQFVKPGKTLDLGCVRRASSRTLLLANTMLFTS